MVVAVAVVVFVRRVQVVVDMTTNAEEDAWRESWCRF